MLLPSNVDLKQAQQWLHSFHTYFIDDGYAPISDLSRKRFCMHTVIFSVLSFLTFLTSVLIGISIYRRSVSMLVFLWPIGLFLTVMGSYLMLAGPENRFLSSDTGHVIEALCLALGVALYIVGMLLPGRRVSVRISSMSDSERLRPGFSMRVLSVIMGLLVVSSCFSAFVLMGSGRIPQSSVVEPEDIVIGGVIPVPSKEEIAQQQFEHFFGITHKLAHNPSPSMVRTQ
jgi:hypothetical protein